MDYKKHIIRCVLFFKKDTFFLFDGSLSHGDLATDMHHLVWLLVTRCY